VKKLVRREVKIMETIIDREERLRKIALYLFERCKSENLTVYDFNRMAEILKIIVTTETKI
jgi:predicted HTH domain antitoxin